MEASAMDLTLSDLVNEAVRRSLADDAEDLSAFDTRRRERSVSFEDLVRSLKRRGKL